MLSNLNDRAKASGSFFSAVFIGILRRQRLLLRMTLRWRGDGMTSGWTGDRMTLRWRRDGMTLRWRGDGMTLRWRSDVSSVFSLSSKEPPLPLMLYRCGEGRAAVTGSECIHRMFRLATEGLLHFRNAPIQPAQRRTHSAGLFRPATCCTNGTDAKTRNDAG